jgi:hypothetical protein
MMFKFWEPMPVLAGNIINFNILISYTHGIFFLSFVHIDMIQVWGISSFSHTRPTSIRMEKPGHFILMYFQGTLQGVRCALMVVGDLTNEMPICGGHFIFSKCPYLTSFFFFFSRYSTSTHWVSWEFFLKGEEHGGFTIHKAFGGRLYVGPCLATHCRALIFVKPYLNPSLGLATKARACKGVGQEGSPRITFHVPMSAKECEGVNPHTSK